MLSVNFKSCSNILSHKLKFRKHKFFMSKSSYFPRCLAQRSIPSSSAVTFFHMRYSRHRRLVTEEIDAHGLNYPIPTKFPIEIPPEGRNCLAAAPPNTIFSCCHTQRNK